MSTPQQSGQAVPGAVPPNVVAALETDAVQVITAEQQLLAEASASEAGATLNTAVTQVGTDATTVVADVVAAEGNQ